MTSDLLREELERAIATMPAERALRRGHQYDHGLAWVNHPEGRGGLGLSASAQRAVNDALREAGVPPAGAPEAIGVALAGPTIAAHADDRLCERFLRATFTGEERWCQLFSEPDAGSDLAGLACRAERDGEGWVVNGAKVWTTNAHLATRALLLARTDPGAPKRHGITYFALDMAAAGVEVRPLRQMTGQAEFSEVFLTDVVIPDGDRVGELNDGWSVARTTLLSERTSISGGQRTRSDNRPRGAIAEAMRLWSELPDDRRHPSVRDQLIRLWCAAQVHRLTNLRSAAQQAGRLDGSIAKLAFTQLNQQAYELCMTILGADALVGYDYELRRVDHLGYAGPAGTAREYFLRSRANSIEGGTTEIQRNIIAERSLGLPRETDG
jgi:alkylation response protein AidB-like acyl-CoA dehydrogenase